LPRLKPHLVMSVLGAALTVVLSPALGGLSVTSSDASQVRAPRVLAVTVEGPDTFSPNGDGKGERARFKIRMEKRAQVKVKVLRYTGQDHERVVGPIRLGEHRSGETVRWAWSGRTDGGKRVASDGCCSVKIVAKTHTGRVQVVRRSLEIDNVFSPKVLAVHDDTVYPRTTVAHDRLWFGLRYPAGVVPHLCGLQCPDAMRRGTLRITKPGGDLVYSSGERRWRPRSGYQVAWDGTDQRGRRVPAGTYHARVHSTDAAKNSGRTPRIRVHVSDEQMVVTTGTVTVSAADANYPFNPCANSTANGCGDFPDCGSITTSSAYLEPGALSYRSSTACSTDPWRQRVYAVHNLDRTVQLPRGLVVSEVTMRGKPTVAGESDTAQLGVPGASITSEATAAEVLTTATATPVDPQTLVLAPPSGWSVITTGEDSYDVADFTVEYTYLAPR
jgi:flagellar hook assembly protein FlgD